MEGTDCNVMEKGEMFGGKRGKYPKDGHSYQRGYSNYVNRVSRPVELLHFNGNNADFTRFVQHFVDGKTEIMNWERGVHYSLNKNKRWNINECFKNIVEGSLEDFEEYECDVTIEIKSALDMNSEVNCRSVFSNRDQVPVRHSKSKAHGRLKVDHDSTNGLYVGIYEKNDSMYKSAGFNDSYSNTRMKKEKHKVPFGMEQEGTLDTMEFNESEVHTEKHVSTLPTFSEVSLENFIVERKQNTSNRKVRKGNKIMINLMDAKKRKLEYYWDYVTASVIAEDNTENQANANVREESFLQHLPALKTVSVKVEFEKENSLSQEWEIYKGSTFPRRLRIENKHEKIMMIMEENFKVDSLFNLSVSYDDSETCAEKMDLLELILLENSPLTLQTLCHLVQALSSAQKIRSPHDTGTVLIMNRDSMHRSIFKYGKEERVNEEVCDLLSDSVCGICFTGSDLSCLQSCGHTFCSQCWRFYTATQIRTGSTSMTCPAYLCGSHLDLTTVACHAGAEMFQQFKLFQVNAAVEQDSRYHWCPNPRCQRIVMIQKTGVHTVDCLCGISWCVSCKESSHWPASCQDFLDYRSFNKEIEKYNLLENTVEGRPCPKCGIIFEKIYGCNHMSCSYCGTHFCWGCGGEHSSSSYCGGMRVPLESIRILPLPTEKFSLARIESFQQYNAFIKFKLITGRQKEKIIQRFLAANKENYFEMLKTGIEENEEYVRVKNLVDQSVATMKTSKLLMTNNFLTNKFSSKVKFNHLLRAKPLLMELRSLLKHQKVTKKSVGITLKDMEQILNRLDKYNLRIARMTKYQ